MSAITADVYKRQEYKEYTLKEGEFNEAKHKWHVENNTYGFSHGLVILIMTIGILTFLGIFSLKIGLAGAALAIVMTCLLYTSMHRRQ